MGKRKRSPQKEKALKKRYLSRRDYACDWAFEFYNKDEKEGHLHGIKQLVKYGVTEFQQWDLKAGSFEDLGACSFVDANLFEASFSGDLRGSDFSLSHLQKASFQKADLQEAHFYRNDLHGTVFRDCDLRRAVFSEVEKERSVMDRVHFYDVNLSHASFEFFEPVEVTMHRVDLSHTKLEGFRISDADVLESKFDFSDMTDTYIKARGFIPTGDKIASSFRSATIDNTFFSQIDFSGADFAGAKLRDVYFSNCTVTAELLSHCESIDRLWGVAQEELEKLKTVKPELMVWWDGSWQEASWDSYNEICNTRRKKREEEAWSTLRSREASTEERQKGLDFLSRYHMDFPDCDLSELSLRCITVGGELRAIEARSADLRYVQLRLRTSLQGACLEGADLSGIEGKHCDFVEADLFEAKLKGAYLVQSNFQYVNFGGVDFDGACLREANLGFAYLGGCKNLMPEQLIDCSDLSEVWGLDEIFLSQVREQSPELMAWWDGKTRVCPREEWVRNKGGSEDGVQKRLALIQAGSQATAKSREGALVWLVSEEHKDFRGTSLKNIRNKEQLELWEVDFREANFAKAVLPRWKFINTLFDTANFEKAKMHGLAYFDNCSFTKACLEGTDLSYSFMKDTSLKEAALSGGSLENAIVARGAFYKADCSKLRFSNANVLFGDFRLSNLEDVSFAASNFVQCHFGRAKGFTPEQASECERFMYVWGLSKTFLEKVQKLNPHLMAWWDGSSRQIAYKEWCKVVEEHKENTDRMLLRMRLQQGTKGAFRSID